MKGDDEGVEAELNYDETLGLGDFVAGERDEPLAPPAGFTEWRGKGAVWAASAPAGRRSGWHRRS